MGDATDSIAHEATEASEVEFDVVSLLNPKVAEAFRNVSVHFRSMSEPELIESTRPTDVDWKLRLSFWEKVREARLTNQTLITNVSIYDGIMSKPAFFDMLGNPSRIAFLSRPIIEHTKMYEAINRLALAKIFKMLETIDLDPKNLGTLLRVAEQAGNRAYGAVAQKMQIQSKNLNVDVTASQLSGQVASDTKEDVQKQIEALQAKLIGGPRDVTPSEE